MRILFATNNLRLPADLSAGYADLEIAGVVSSLSEALAAVRGAPKYAPIEAVILDAELNSPRDHEEKLTLEDALVALRKESDELRLVVTTDSAEPIEAVQRVGAQQFISYDQTRSAANLAAMLGLISRSKAATIIAVVGLQGGAGRTTFAQVIASALAERTENTNGRGGVLLWEMDLKHPTIAFDQEIDLVTAHHGRRTIAKLLNAGPITGDESMPIIASSIISTNQSRLGYDLLLAPHGLREVMAIYQAYPQLLELRQRMAKILSVVSRHYQIVVLDTGTDLLSDPGASVALASASAIAVLATPSPAGLSSVMAMRTIIRDLHASKRSRLIINRVRRDDVNYLNYCQQAAGDVLPLLGVIPEGAPLTAFAALAPKLLELRDN